MNCCLGCLRKITLSLTLIYYYHFLKLIQQALIVERDKRFLIDAQYQSLNITKALLRTSEKTCKSHISICQTKAAQLELFSFKSYPGQSQQALWRVAFKLYNKITKLPMPPKIAESAVSAKKEEGRKEEIKIEQPKKQQSSKLVVNDETKQQEPKSPKSPKSPRSPRGQQPQPQQDSDELKKKKQAEMFKKYLDQTGIAMAFQVIFAQILDKKLDEGKLFSYTAMRLRQIGQDLEKIKISKK